MGKNDYSTFIRELTGDPVERAVLKTLLIKIKNKYKVKMTAEKLVNHNRDAVRMTEELLQRPELHKSFNVVTMKKIRYQTPEEYARWIQNMTDQLDYALALRSRFWPQQTYSAIGDHIAGLGEFTSHPDMTAAQKSCILAANYVMLASPRLKEQDFIYDSQKRFIRLTDSDLIDFISNHSDDAVRIQSLITDHRLLRAAELDAALADGTVSLLNGSL